MSMKSQPTGKLQEEVSQKEKAEEKRLEKKAESRILPSKETGYLKTEISKEVYDLVKELIEYSDYRPSEGALNETIKELIRACKIRKTFHMNLSGLEPDI